MWEKIKGIFAVIGAFLTVIFFSVFIIFLRRRDSDGSGSDGIDERDSKIEAGFDGIEDTATRCEERLRRAEEILRQAVERSRKES